MENRYDEQAFWIDVPFDPPTWNYFQKAQIDSLPFLSEGALRVDWSVLLHPESETYRQLLDCDNPVILRSGYHEFDPAMNALPKEAYDRFLADFEGRFLGIHGIHERMGGVGWAYPLEQIIEEIKQKSGIDAHAPATRENCFVFMRQLFNAITQKPYYAVYSTHAAPVDHFLYRIGVSLCSAEIGAFMPCTAMQLAMTRGAARQFDRLWGTALTCWSLDGAKPSHTDFSFSSPDAMATFGANSDWCVGPRFGPSLSLQKRTLYLSYMAGCNVLQNESDCNYECQPHLPTTPPCSIYVAGYEEGTPADDADHPLYLSPIGKMYNDFYNTIVLRHNRGSCCRPVAVLVDELHGFNTAYDIDHILISTLLNEPRDTMLRAFVNTVFPWEDLPMGYHNALENKIMVDSPYGDIFDFFTQKVDEDILENYPIALLIGQPELTDCEKKMLKHYVASGGILVANAAQTDEELERELFGIVRSTECFRSTMSRSRATGMHVAEKPFEAPRLSLGTAESVFTAVTAEEHELPIITRNYYGKGQAYFTSPNYLLPCEHTAPKASEQGDWEIAPNFVNDSAKGPTLLQCFGHLLADLTKDCLPVTVRGHIEYMINQTADSIIVSLFNNHGVTKEQGTEETIDARCDEPVCLRLDRLPFPIFQATEWLTGQTVCHDPSDNMLHLLVPAGDVRIVEIVRHSLPL